MMQHDREIDGYEPHLLSEFEVKQGDEHDRKEKEECAKSERAKLPRFASDVV